MFTMRCLLSMDLLLNLVDIDMRDLSRLTIEDLCNLFECGTACLDVEEVDENKLDEDPDCVDKREVVMVGEIGPGDGVGVVSKNQCCLDSEIHDHETLCTEFVWQNLECISDEQTRPGKSIKDTKEPNEDNLRSTSRRAARFLVKGRGDCPGKEHQYHPSCSR